MKRLFFLMLLLGCLSLPVFAMDESDSYMESTCDVEQFEKDLNAVIKYLNDLSAMFGKTRSGSVKSITRQFRKIDKYYESDAAQRAHKLITDGFPCPNKGEITPEMSKKMTEALRALEKYRRAAGKLLRHLERNFTSCDNLATNDDDDAVASLLTYAEFRYTMLYETLGVDEEEIPDWDNYYKE